MKCQFKIFYFTGQKFHIGIDTHAKKAYKVQVLNDEYVKMLHFTDFSFLTLHPAVLSRLFLSHIYQQYSRVPINIRA